MPHEGLTLTCGNCLRIERTRKNSCSRHELPRWRVGFATVRADGRRGDGENKSTTTPSAVATPTALMVGTGRGAQLGPLIKGPEILESTRAVDTVVLGKTGTVTTGHMALVDVTVADGEDEDAVLRLVGALEDASEHPIARAIADGARERGARSRRLRPSRIARDLASKVPSMAARLWSAELGTSKSVGSYSRPRCAMRWSVPKRSVGLL